MNDLSQRYISSELTHFIGRGLDKEKQFSILLKIISEGIISHPPHTKNVEGNIIFNKNTSFSSNQMYNPQVICFCDIPLMDLTIHIEKYSQFGISFKKYFLISNGATPVFYVPKTSRVKIPRVPTDKELEEMRITQINKTEYYETDKGLFFDEMIRNYHTLFQHISQCINPTEPTWRIKFDVRHFFDFYIFSFIKFYDPSLPENHCDNYYFEREWRILGNLIFEKKDIYRIILPCNYAEKFHKECQDYIGQITLL
jgi:hypothetical protein